MAEIALVEQDSPNTISEISEKLDTLELDTSGKEAATAVTMEEESSILQPVQRDSKESSAPLETTADDTASDDSDYEEADDDDDFDGETKPVSKLRSKDSDDESDSKEKSSASDEDDADERPKADGEEKEEEKEKKLDDDEDRRNPQYIPKKGAFYEHDDRTTVESEVNSMKESGVDDETNVPANNNNVNDGPNRPIRSKKVWTDSSGDMWSHDLYVEEEQSPKTPRELINTYGYDIRNEEAPPKARRRRRYGRGPKSYTRKWDDEPAYKSNNAANPSRSGNRRSFVNKPSEFPEINANKNREQKNEETPQKVVDSSRGRREASKPKIEDTRTNSNQNSVIKRKDTNRQRSRSRPKTETNKHVETSRPSTNSNVQNNKPDDAQKRGGRGHFSGYGPVPCLEFTPSRGRGRNLPDSKKESGYGPCYKPLPHSQLFSEEEMYSTDDVVRMIQPVARISADEIELHSNTNEKRPPEPPVNRSKRYSAQRQRSLPETTVTYSPPVPPTAPTFYQPETHAPPPANQPPADRYPHLVAVPDYPPPQPPPMPMVAFAPPPFPPPPPAQPTYAAAYPMPTVIRTPQLPPPQLAPPQMQPPQLPPQMQPPQMQPQMAPPQLPPPHPQPVQQVQEVYQGQNGITYYSPQSQAAIPRQTPSRRKKVAIPIVPPPEADMSLPPPPLGHPEQQADAQT